MDLPLPVRPTMATVSPDSIVRSRPLSTEADMLVASGSVRRVDRGARVAEVDISKLDAAAGRA